MAANSVFMLLAVLSWQGARSAAGSRQAVSRRRAPSVFVDWDDREKR